jgi:hypothetical protein
MWAASGNGSLKTDHCQVVRTLLESGAAVGVKNIVRSMMMMMMIVMMMMMMMMIMTLMVMTVIIEVILIAIAIVTH